MNVMDRFTNAALGAGATENPFLGRPISVAAFNGFLEASVGGTALLTFSLTVGGKSLVVGGTPCQVLAAFGALPDTLDIQDEKVWANTPISLLVTNSSAGGLPYRAYIRLSDVPRSGNG